MSRLIERVLQVHTRYRQAGGEDAAVDAERRLLEAAGIEVRQVIFDNAQLQERRSVAGDLRLAASAVWSRAALQRVRTAIVAQRPQVVHVHNTFPAASPSIYAAADTEAVRVVQTLHNYRFICPSAIAFRDGHVCTDCLGRGFPWPAIRHACVRGSRAQSAVAAATTTVHRALGTFTRRIDGFIALTSFQRGMMIAGGLPPDRIRVIPNFVEPDPGASHDSRRRGVLFVGRLSTEKGIATLLRAAALEPGVVRIVGDGPQALEVNRAQGQGHVEALGPLPRPAVIDELRGSIALVLPSVWFEGLPLVVLEAYATGTPVIASDIGSLAELVGPGRTGLLAGPNDASSLARSIRWALDHTEEMGRMGANARRAFEDRFSGRSHLAELLDCYEWVLGVRPGMAETGMDRSVQDTA